MTWQAAIDKLNGWLKNPDYLTEDDLIPPTKSALLRAIDISTAMAKHGKALPERVVPDGNGGVDFDMRTGEFVESVEIDRWGVAETVVVKDLKVVSRETWTI